MVAVVAGLVIYGLSMWRAAGFGTCGTMTMAVRKKSAVAFWATAVLVIGLVGYPLSLGPAVLLAYK